MATILRATACAMVVVFAGCAESQPGTRTQEGVAPPVPSEVAAPQDAETPVEPAPDSADVVRQERFRVSSDDGMASVGVVCETAQCALFVEVNKRETWLRSQPLPVLPGRMEGELSLSPLGPDDMMTGPETADYAWRFGTDENAVEIFLSPFGQNGPGQYIVQQTGGFEHVRSAFAIMVVDETQPALRTVWEKAPAVAPQSVEIIPLSARSFEVRTQPHFTGGPPASATEYEIFGTGETMAVRQRRAPSTLD